MAEGIQRTNKFKMAYANAQAKTATDDITDTLYAELEKADAQKTTKETITPAQTVLTTDKKTIKADLVEDEKIATTNPQKMSNTIEPNNLSTSLTEDNATTPYENSAIDENYNSPFIKPFLEAYTKKESKNIRKSFLITKTLNDKFAATAKKMKISENELFNLLIDKAL